MGSDRLLNNYLRDKYWQIRNLGSSRELMPTLARLMLPLIFVSWFVFLSLTSPVFLTWLNLFNVTRQVAVIGILSLGQLICLVTGNIDLSVGVFLGLSGAVLAGYSLEVGVMPAFLIVVLLTLVWGILNGFLSSRGAASISVIVTLSTMFVARGITLIFTEGKPFVGFPMPYAFLGQGNLGPVPWALIVFAITALFTHFLLQNTPFGRHLYALGGNRQAAVIAGININLTTIIVFIFTALFSFMGTIILLGRVASAQANAGYGMEMDSIAAVLIGGASVSGGRGKVLPTLLGVFMLGFINNGLNLLGISSYYQYIFKGMIILIAVVVDQVVQRKN